eukprot:363099-Chlamydomonas_euryale.AAC.3
MQFFWQWRVHVCDTRGSTQHGHLQRCMSWLAKKMKNNNNNKNNNKNKKNNSNGGKRHAQPQMLRRRRAPA